MPVAFAPSRQCGLLSVLGCAFLAAALGAAGCAEPDSDPNGGATADSSLDDATAITFDTLGRLPDSGAVKTDTVTMDGVIQLSDGAALAADDVVLSPDSSGPAGCGFLPNPKAGDPGASCKGAVDCDSGLCVEGPDGKVCTVKCTDCCPGGWVCTQFGDIDPVFGCVPKSLRLCQPCMQDKDCVTQGDAGLCLDYGAAGRFCGSTCTGNGDCPSSYECKTAQGVQGSSKQCVRTIGFCTCSAKAIAEGMSTVCVQKNAAGSCSGVRKCIDSGLTECTAKIPAAENCNGVDDNCDGATDELGATGCTNLWTDGDGDGFGASPSKGGKNQCLCAAAKPYTAVSPTDCDDTDTAIKPSAPEICNDIDDNCDGKTDAGCDNDKDGYCDVSATVVGKPKVCAKGTKDCDDAKSEINPGLPELCGNGVDENCNGQTDNEEGAAGCQPYFYDQDKDSWGVGEPKCLCQPTGNYTAGNFGDCNDNDPQVNPQIPELCSNGKDDNCSGSIDEPDSQNCEKFWADKDSDGWGTGKPKCLCAPTAALTVKKDGDCDDLDAKVNPAVNESCNDVDDNCNGKVDEINAFGCTKLYADADNDGYGDPGEFACQCKPDAAHSVPSAGDCDDTKSEINPKAKEACDGFDNNCNAIADEPNATGCKVYYTDLDGDGAGDLGQKACLCAKAAPYTASLGNDCNDKKDTVFPGALEKCNNEDDNCDGFIDEENAIACSEYYYDEDGDTFGAPGKSKCLCKPTKPYNATKAGDCNDISPLVYPGAPETCNGIDDNCDTKIDETGTLACTNYYVDIDGDGYGDSNQAPQCLCKPTGAYVTAQGNDCNDLSKTTYPTAPEGCDGIDTNCNGVIDDPGAGGCKAYFLDADGDGYGVSTQTQCLCAPAGAFSAQLPGDCNDNAQLVNPKALEVCNSIDDNCNGIIDNDSPQAKPYYVDGDNDSYGAGVGVVLCQSNGVNKVLQGGDCADNDPNINPSKSELCNGKDDNCDIAIDNGTTAQLCPNSSNASAVCTGGKCGLNCAPKWFDVDGQFNNGCECAADAKYGSANACTVAENLGALPDSGAAASRSGNIMPGEDGDWYTFYAQDIADSGGGCDQFNVKVQFTSNPDGKFVFDVFRGGCNAGEQLCGGETNHSWGTNFYGALPSGPGHLTGTPGGTVVKSPSPEMGGECKCTSTPGATGMNICKDNSANFFVRVYRAGGAPAYCGGYAIKFSNGP